MVLKCVLVVAIATCALPPSLFAELIGNEQIIETPSPPRLSFDEEERLATGLMVAFRSRESADARTVRLANLFVHKDDPPTPFLPAGRFTAVLSGYLYVDLGDAFSFRMIGRGAATVSVNGVTICEGSGNLTEIQPQTVELHSGYNPLRIEYAHPGGGADFELRWAGRDFLLEPLPPTQLFHDPNEPQLFAFRRLRRGRELMGTLNCTKCHDPPLPLEKERAMPELAKDNPRLHDVGARLQPSWVFAWILNPQTLHEEATMPMALPAGDTRRQRDKAADLSAFLSTLGADAPLAAQSLAGGPAVETGERLYEQRGCIGCHRFSSPEETDYFDRISLHYIDSKYREGALVDFLLQPHQRYAWNRMPDFQLAVDEAVALGTFVREQAKGELERPVELDSANVERGRTLFHQVGCVNCHETGLDAPQPPVRRAWCDVEADNEGCLSSAASARATAPDFSWNEQDRQAVQSFLRSDPSSLTRVIPVEASHRFVSSLRCTVCHTLDNELNVLEDVVMEESVIGLPPEQVPQLTWLGEKLQRKWTEPFVAGRLKYRPRPWLNLRMPIFPVHARLLAEGLAVEHGQHSAIEDAKQHGHARDAALVAIGERLTGRAPQGFFCTECHAVGDHPPAGAFDHKGVNLALAAERLHHDYYIRWITAPKRFDPGSKMPTFSPDGKTTEITDVLQGDAQRQFEAMWQYLLSLAE